MPCIHHWLLGLPVKGVVTGRYLHCRRRYRRKELTYADHWNGSVVQERRWNEATPVNDWSF